MNKDKIVLGIAIFALILSLISDYLVFLRPSPMQSYQEGYHDGFQDGYRADSSMKIAYGGGGAVELGILQPDSNFISVIRLNIPGIDIGRYVKVKLIVEAPESTFFLTAGLIVPRQETTAVTFNDVIIDKRSTPSMYTVSDSLQSNILVPSSPIEDSLRKYVHQ